MKQASFSELRNNARHFFDLVEAGIPVRILRNGKPIADIEPVPTDIPSSKRRQAQPLVLDGVEICRLIMDQRDTGA